jgi:hypothetical protein
VTKRPPSPAVDESAGPEKGYRPRREITTAASGTQMEPLTLALILTLILTLDP